MMGLGLHINGTKRICLNNLSNITKLRWDNINYSESSVMVAGLYLIIEILENK